MHYTVLVTGPNPEEQMLPFCESLDEILRAENKAFAARRRLDPNASVDPVYLERIDVLKDRKLDWEADKKKGTSGEETFAEYLDEYYGGEVKFFPKAIYASRPEIKIWESKTGGFGTLPESTIWHWDLEFGTRFAVIGEDGEIESVIVYVISQPKWDWYNIGGRWRDFFKVKPEAITRVRYENADIFSSRNKMVQWLDKVFPDRTKEEIDPTDASWGRSDQLVKGDIDFEGMREEERARALASWDKFHAVTGGRPYRTYGEVFAEYKNRDETRAILEADPVHRAIREANLGWFDDDDLTLLRLPREAYGQAYADRTFSTYSLLHNGVWQDREAFVRSPNKDTWGHFEKRDWSEWNNLIWDTIQSLSDDTLLTLIDYHS
jgi:hypothetical protein